MRASFTLVLCTLLIVLSLGHAHAQWTPKAYGQVPPSHSVLGLDAVDASVVWAVTGDADIGYQGLPVPEDHQPVVLRTTDGGDTWNSWTLPAALGRAPVTVMAVSAEEMYFSACTLGNDIWSSILIYTLDGGDTWQTRVQGAMDQSIGLFLHRFNEQEWFSYSYNHGATSADGGSLWETSPVPEIEDGEYVFSAAPVNGWAVQGDNIWIPTSRGRLFMSDDKGITWSTVNTSFNPNRAVHTVAFHDDLHGMMISGFNSNFGPLPTLAAITDDGGDTWTTVNGAAGAIGCLSAVPGVPGAYVGVSDEFMGPGSYITLDNGNSWETLDQTTAYMALEFTSPTAGWAGLGAPAVDDGTPGLYKWTGGHVGMRERAMDGSLLFPNPATDRLTLRSDALAPNDRIELIDATGRLVRSERAMHAMTHVLDVQGLVPGAYQVRWISAQGTATRTVIIGD